MFINTCCAKIITTNAINVIKQILKFTDIDTLVIFDIDGVWIYANNQILKSKNADTCKFLVKKLKQQIRKDKIHNLL